LFESQSQPFVSTFNNSNQKIPVSVFSPKGFYPRAKETSQIILDAAVASLSVVEKYLDIPFWLPKLDLVVVPNMLFAGMENLGCCFLHVTTTSEGHNSSIQGDVLHEVAHHWVGNLVGMSTKMKEGIVQYIERLFVERLFGSTKKSGRRNSHQPKVPSSKSNSTCVQLLANFHSQFNDEVYQKCLQHIEAVAEACGEKQFQYLLQDMLKKNFFAFRPDDIVATLLSANL